MNKSKGHLKASTVVKINNLAQSVGWPIVATILGLLLGAVIIILSGYDPLKVYAVMVDKSLLSSYYRQHQAHQADRPRPAKALQGADGERPH